MPKKKKITPYLKIEGFDGSALDLELLEAYNINLGFLERFLEVCEDWSDSAKRKAIIALQKYDGDFSIYDNPDNIDIE